MICRRAWQGTDILMITDIPTGGHMQQKEKKFNGATSRFHKFPPPVTPSDSWRCQGQGSYHFIPLFSVSPHLSFHPSPLPHLPTLHLCSRLWNLFMCVSGSCSRWIHFSECFIKVHPVARPARRPPAWPRRPLPLVCSHVRAHVCAATCMWPATNGSQVGKREEKKKSSEIPLIIILPLHLPPPVPWWFMFATHLSGRGLSYGNPAVWLTACQWGSNHQSGGGL